MKRNRYTEGTPKQAMWEAFVDGDAQAAIDQGFAHHVNARSIKSTVKAWLIEYGNGAAMPIVERPAKLPAKAARQPREKAAPVLGRTQQEKVYVETRPKPVRDPNQPTQKQIAAKQYALDTKNRIKVSYAPKKAARLIKQGPQQSIIMWEHDGSEQCISNEWLGLPVERREPLAVRRYDM
jgi:hypothetical protein